MLFVTLLEERVVPAVLLSWVFFVLACGGAEPSESDKPDPADLATAVAGIVEPFLTRTGEADKAFGMIVRIDAPGIGSTFAFGIEGRDGPPLVGSESWSIGSVSKTVTSLLIAEAVTRGDLSLDGPIASLLPGGWMVPSGVAGEAITVAHLLTHVSGLPRYPQTLENGIAAARSVAAMIAAWSEYSQTTLRDDLAATALTSEPGADYVYSDFGFALAQLVLENRRGTTYAELVGDLALALGWRGTAVPEDPAAAAFDTLQGHMGPGMVEVPPFAAPVWSGDALVLSSADDLGRLLRVFSGLDTAPSPSLAQAIDLVEHSYFERNVRGGVVAQGLGIGIIPGSDFVFYKKNGVNAGITTVILYDPARHLSVAIGANVAKLSEAINRSACQIIGVLAARSGAEYPDGTLERCAIPF